MNILELLGMGGGAPTAPAGPNGAAPNASPVGGFLSRLGLDDPDRRSRLGQGLIALGGSMMKAGGPSYTPTNFLGAAGDGAQSFAKAYGAAGDDALRRQYLQAQIGNMGANTRLHQIQAAQAQAQAQARAQFNGQSPVPSGAIIPPTPAPVGSAPGTPAGASVPGASVPGALGGPAQAPGSAPLDIRPPQGGAPQEASAPQGAPAPQAAPQGGGNPYVARRAELESMARQARAAGYETLANQYSEQALALEKHAASKGMILRPDGTAQTVPGYAAGVGSVSQAEAAGKAQGQLPTDFLKMNKESELRREEQVLKDQSGDKTKFDDRSKEMNATWNANEYNKKFLGATNIRAGFDRAYADKSGLATAQLVLDWYKLNDPGSVVSQNEMTTLSTKTQSLGEGLVATVNQALGGGGMSDENKMKLLKNMDGKYQDQRRTYEKQRDNQRTLAGKLGTLDPALVIPDLAELHGAWKSPQEIAAAQAAQDRASRIGGLGGGGATPAPSTAQAIPTLAPNDPKLRSMKKGDQFYGADGKLYTID